MHRFWAAAALLLLAAAGLPGQNANGTPAIHQALERLYSFDFAGTHRILDRHLTEKPDDPLGYMVRASAYLFSELHRLGILEAEFFVDDERITAKKKGRPDEEVKRAMQEALAQARRHAEVRLEANPRDEDALFTMSAVSGIETDYAALVEKRQLGSLAYARQSQKFAVRLLDQNPHYYDAYLTAGVSEYLVGSMPFFMRWFARFDRVKGSKKQAVENLKLVAQSGTFLRPFAKILLSIIYLREKRPEESERMLREFACEYPDNPLIRRELARLERRH
ncbi:MAG TPA: hypothetical protein PLP04_02265 [Bryobacteraceae bacterium]|nr:hypothetical protein [Bryobacteraceae bacterium]HPQ14021.1 hypothetical protein [Bryobacteraceae bacterium]